MMKPLAELFKLLEKPRRCVITCHTKPDGDAAGSVLGLWHYLRKKGHEAEVIVPSEIPPFLGWLPGADQVTNAEASPDRSAQLIRDAELIFCLDFNNFSRTKVLEPLLEAATQPKIILDHHLFPAPVWDYGISEPEASSTCELVYQFIGLAGDEDLVDKTIGTCLYTGMVTDTGSFRFAATAPSTHRAAAHLLELGVVHPEIHEAVNESWSENRMRFLGYLLVERMELFPEYGVGLIAISKKDLKLFGLSLADTEGLVNYPLAVGGIRCAVLITERGDEVKLSFRSKGTLDVNQFARTHFNGGGHLNASGGRSTEGFNETVKRFKSLMPHLAPLHTPNT